MKIKGFTIHHLSHCSFLFESPNGARLLTEPLFLKEFEWNQGMELYLSPPNIKVEDIKRCDAIFVSHIHGDHCDHDAILKIHARTQARIIAPDDVLDSFRALGIKQKHLVHIEDGAELTIGDMTLTPLAGYDRAFDEKNRPNKFSLIIKAGLTSLFFSGDCHEVPPGLKGKRVDAIFWWPYQDNERLLAFCRSFEFRQWVLMHGDRFAPGNFLCNLDYAKEKERILKLLPTVEIVIPERATQLDK